MKNQEASGESNQATKQKCEAHTKQRQPAPKADKKNGADQCNLRSRRTAFDFPAQLPEAFLNFLRLKQRDCAIKILWLEIEQKRERDPLEIAHSIRCFHRRTRQDANAPRLRPQFLGKFWRE